MRREKKKFVILRFADLCSRSKTPVQRDYVIIFWRNFQKTAYWMMSFNFHLKQMVLLHIWKEKKRQANATMRQKMRIIIARDLFFQNLLRKNKKKRLNSFFLEFTQNPEKRRKKKAASHHFLGQCAHVNSPLGWRGWRRRRCRWRCLSASSLPPAWTSRRPPGRERPATTQQVTWRSSDCGAWAGTRLQQHPCAGWDGANCRWNLPSLMYWRIIRFG